MKAVSLDSHRHLAGTPKPRTLDRMAEKGVRKQLAAITDGQLTVIDGDRQDDFGQGGRFSATITVREPAFWSDVAFGGAIGAAEAYMAGAWDCDDLVSLVRLLLRNRSVLEGMEGGAARLTKPLQKAFHWVNRNTRDGARRNISAHYDLGNDFFGLWLDETMMYSSAIFETPEVPLYDAQIHRLDMICQRLNLRPDDHLVEIGTGWGGLAIHAAQHYGCRVTTTTISKEQHRLAAERIAAAGLEDRIELLLEDYRDLEGQYDKLVSIEMIEAIGWRQYDTYFKKCGELLKPGGTLLIQAITIAETRYEEAKRSVDFIQRYIFPGSNLPSVKAMVNAVAANSDMMVSGLHDIGLDYALTLNHWRQRFFERIEEVRELGYSETFIRMWEYYLCYCEGGFEERAISDVHLLAERPA
ncbi:MAG: cyclopropane-fatty-acyl-phospholipid synthase family protein [Pseudomonadota bacterium]